jgi:hypothetical protein
MAGLYEPLRGRSLTQGKHPLDVDPQPPLGGVASQRRQLFRIRPDVDIAAAG